MHIAIDKSNGNYYLLENDKVNWPNNNCVPAYDIDIEFADDVIEYRLSNFMFRRNTNITVAWMTIL